MMPSPRPVRAARIPGFTSRHPIPRPPLPKAVPGIRHRTTGRPRPMHTHKGRQGARL